MDETIQLFEKALEDIGLPNVVTALQEISKFDFNHLFNGIANTMRKDEASIAMAVPALVRKSLELGTLFGIALKDGDPLKIAETSGNLQRWEKELSAVTMAEAKQASHPLHGEPGEKYPFENEKEAMRILIKRWNLDPKWAAVIGVSEGTPSEFPAGFIV